MQGTKHTQRTLPEKTQNQYRKRVSIKKNITRGQDGLKSLSWFQRHQDALGYVVSEKNMF